MLGIVRRSIRHKVTLVVLATTIAALLFSGLALVVYDARSYRDATVRDLITQADIVGRASTAALAFQDTAAAHQNLALLRVRPQIVAAAIYTAGGRFASYARADAGPPAFPEHPGADGFRVDRDRLVLKRAIADADERLGTVYVEARFEGPERLGRFLLMVLAAMIGSVLVALWLSSRLQATVTQPILEIADVARRVGARQDYTLRVRKTTDDETGYLVSAFNDMLGEVDQRTRELEESNRRLHQEMSERQEAERALLEADRRKDEFLATLAHELRNPLAPIRNAVYLLKIKGDAAPEARRAHELIDRQVQHMVRLIEDLLDISRITRDLLELRPSTFSLAELVHEVHDASLHAMEEASHAFDVRVPEAPVMVRADRARLAQAISNIVNNAVKYTPKGGRIVLTAETRGGDVEITVVDTGIGLPQDKLADIFQPFSQLDRSLEKTRGGLGIGLALAQRLVALHGGKLSAWSEGVGKGSVFRISLPIVVERPTEHEALPGETPETPGERQRILVADDNHDSAESLAALVRAMGHDAATAHDGMEAFELARTSRFDVAILDIGMPRLNGYDLARNLRREAWGRGMLLVALTGWGAPEDRQRAFEAGFDEHLTKPIHPEQLADLLSRDRAAG